MESKILNLTAQLGLLALVIWVIAALMGKKKEVVITRPKSNNRMNRNSPVWNQSPVQAPSASAGLLFAPSFVMNPGEA